jgi:hypothetical protein
MGAGNFPLDSMTAIRYRIVWAIGSARYEEQQLQDSAQKIDSGLPANGIIRHIVATAAYVEVRANGNDVLANGSIAPIPAAPPPQSFRQAAQNASAFANIIPMGVTEVRALEFVAPFGAVAEFWDPFNVFNAGVAIYTAPAATLIDWQPLEPHCFVWKQDAASQALGQLILEFR